ncbi:hypothetical protein JCM8208_007356 [Rhodotorula glutinis]
MAIAHAPPHTLARYHYARLLLSPLAPSSSSTPVDLPTVVHLLHRTTADWYGTMGGPVALAEVDVVLVEPARGGDSSEVVIRFPAGATHDLLTALALSPHPHWRLSVLRDAADLGRLGGKAGRGREGYKAWVRDARDRATLREGEVGMVG